jgi:Uncharacterised nucleotidyltransferase
MHTDGSTAATGIWEAVDALIDRAPTAADIRSHRLELLAARRFRQAGTGVPEEFVADERFAAIASMTAPVILERVASALDAPAIVLKGLECAAHYPDPLLRSYGDIDLLVQDAEKAQATLIRAGFVPVGDPTLFVDIHHLRPLSVDQLPLAIEIHSEPKWVEGLPPPPVTELFASAISGTSGVRQMLKPSPEHHALIIAAHSWAHEPLRRLRDLVDIAAVTAHADRTEIARIARTWGIERVWRTTIAVADSLFLDEPEPRVLKLWAQNLRLARERTVLENHVARWVSDYWALPPRMAVRRTPRIIRNEAAVDGTEPWRAKLARILLALRNASRRRSDHEQQWTRRSTDTPDGQDERPSG